MTNFATDIEHAITIPSGKIHLDGFPLGYFGASTGGSAALVAAAQAPSMVKADDSPYAVHIRALHEDERL